MSDQSPQNLALIGYRGTGKSHVARLLAARLGWPATDADDWVEAHTGKSIAEIFQASGESGFRDLETEAVQTLTAGEKQILAMGGGVVLREANRKLIGERCHTIWLTASPEVIARRLALDDTTEARRPSLTGKSPLEEIEEVLNARLPLYKQCADVTIETEGKSPEAVADAILAQLPWNPA
ncbi:shikimate kinase [Blastopirellula marina]|uniref:Shikimate kinase n=1 Tax=Blastopirellula marina TaxID=124 RepID=A0A2S8GEN7_9BACT|nr:shikimate kinase [Blastopirellula marina]PQO42721.1 shikimate kinase [Blastopirellula marina]PTL46487.1 shikimate kinase [Blastopirellula marina]